MNEQTQVLLTTLAQKLGTTTEMLWGVLLRQAPIDAVVDAVWLIVTGVALFFWARMVYVKTKPAGENKYPDWDGEGMFFAWGTVVFLGAIWLLCAGSILTNVVTAIFNPDYWALKQILGALKK